MKQRVRNLIAALLATLAALLLLAGWSLLRAPAAEADAVIVSTLPEGLNGLFTDYTRTELAPRYASGEAISALKQAYSGNNAALSVLERADSVLHGGVRFDKNREFSTEENAENKIAQYGDVAAYSNSTLHWMYSSSDLLVTGVYGKASTTFTVYVDADEGAKLPHIVLVKPHGYFYDRGGYRSTQYLYSGANTFSSPYDACAVYLVNPYTEDTQGGDVHVYIEGGDFYPVFEKGGDKEAFLGELREYETRRRADGAVPDLAELCTDFALITTTSSSLYETYITRNTIDPEENLELWGDLFTKVYEFNGIPTSPSSRLGKYYDPRIQGVRLNFRYMQPIKNSGAYATAYHIGFYEEHYWFANFHNYKNPVGSHQTTQYNIFAMGHEMGHMLDTDGRTFAETTNNVNAAFVYLKCMGMNVPKDWVPYERSLQNLVNDQNIDGKAYDDGKILYKSTNYDHNYMVWWYLENCFPNYWSDLNALYRFGGEADLNDTEEKMVYYSSLVTGVDLGEYFDRWGMYLSDYYGRFVLKNASQNFQTLMQEAKDSHRIEEKFSRFYYADDAEYDYVRTHEKGECDLQKPVLSVVNKEGKNVLSIAGDPSVLGYEVHVLLDGKDTTVGFTRSSQYTDPNSYVSEPSYRVIAVDRFFRTSEPSDYAVGGESVSTGVCRVKETNFLTFEDALSYAQVGDTIELLADCSANQHYLVKDLTIAVAPEAAGDVHLYSNASGHLFQIGANIKFVGRENARLVIEGNGIQCADPFIYASGGTLTAEYTLFRGHMSTYLGGAIYACNSSTLRHCFFENCTGPDGDFITVMSNKTTTLEDCTFDGIGIDVFVKGGGTLVFEKDISALTLGMQDGASIQYSGFEPTREELRKLTNGDGASAVCKDGAITFEEGSYTLTFSADGVEHSYRSDGAFVFGSEPAFFGEKYAVEYRDEETGDNYVAGDKIFPEKDMRFACTLAANSTVTLHYKSGTVSQSVRGDGRVYLPHYDGKLPISSWAGNDGTMYAVGSTAPAMVGAFYAVYVGYFRYDFAVHGEGEEGGYAAYGDPIVLPELHEEGFLGWLCYGELTKGTVAAKGDGVFLAFFEGDELPEKPELPELPEVPEKPTEPEEKPTDPQLPIEPEEKPTDPSTEQRPDPSEGADSGDPSENTQGSSSESGGNGDPSESDSGANPSHSNGNDNGNSSKADPPASEKGDASSSSQALGCGGAAAVSPLFVLALALLFKRKKL